MSDTPDEFADHEAVEVALAAFHSQIPGAIADLAKLYVANEEPLHRARLRGRIDALLEYVENDRSAGIPLRGSFYRQGINWMNVLTQTVNIMGPLLTAIQSGEGVAIRLTHDDPEDEDPEGSDSGGGLPS